MECSSCPGKDRKLLVIVVVGALFVFEKMYSAIGLHLPQNKQLGKYLQNVSE